MFFLGVTAVVLAQAQPDADFIVGLVNYGVLGVTAIGFITRRIRTAGEVTEAVAREERERLRAETAERQVLALYESMRTATLPAITHLADAATAALGPDSQIR